MSENILLHTDIGSDIDDALCLLAMLNHPKCRPKGIYTVNGDVDSRCYIAKKIVNDSGQRIPVIKGESKAISASIPSYKNNEEFLVSDQFFNRQEMELINDNEIILQALSKIGVVENWERYFVKQLMKGDVVLFSIAPLTNIALIIQKYPQLIPKIKKLYIMGARFPMGSLEHNFRFDAGAADIVLASEIPITIVPGSLCARYRMSVDVELKSPAGSYVNQMLRAFVGEKLANRVRQKGLDRELISRIKVTHFSGMSARAEFDYREDLRITLVNFDCWYANYDTAEFWQKAQKILNAISSSDFIAQHGNSYAKTFRSLIPLDISVADVFIPYCYLHPEKIKTTHMTLDCGFRGDTMVLPGEKHEVVVDIDFKHFHEFLQTYLF